MHPPERRFWSSNMKHWFPVAVFLHLDFMDRIYDISKWNHGIKFYLQSTWQRTYSIDSNNRIGQSSNLNNRLSSRSGNEKSLRYGDAQREREREREREIESMYVYGVCCIKFSWIIFELILYCFLLKTFSFAGTLIEALVLLILFLFPPRAPLSSPFPFFSFHLYYPPSFFFYCVSDFILAVAHKVSPTIKKNLNMKTWNEKKEASYESKKHNISLVYTPVQFIKD